MPNILYTPNTDGTGLTNVDNSHGYTTLAVQTLMNTLAAGLTPHADVNLATTSALPAGSYSNGSSGVGATFTVTATGTLTVDSVVTSLNQRILVKNQASGLQNGVYKVTTAGATGVQAVLTRDTDSDSGAALLNALYAVISGTTNASTQWYTTNTSAPTIGTDAITFAQFTSGGNNGNGVKVDTSLTKAGNTLGRAALTGPVTAPAGSNATTIAANSITNAMLAQMATLTLKGNNTGGTANATDLTVAQVLTMLGITLPAGAIVGTTDTQTLTNKRVTKRTGTVASSATPTINTDNVDFYSITALAAAITSFTTNLSGTPTEGQTLWIAITDDGTARSLTWGAKFESSGNVPLPTTTVISTRLDVGFVWNSVTTAWRCVATA